MSSDWRGGSNCMTDLISKLYKRPSVESYTDISFKLPDGGTVQVRVGNKIFLEIRNKNCTVNCVFIVELGLG